MLTNTISEKVERISGSSNFNSKYHDRGIPFRRGLERNTTTSQVLVGRPRYAGYHPDFSERDWTYGSPKKGSNRFCQNWATHDHESACASSVKATDCPYRLRATFGTFWKSKRRYSNPSCLALPRVPYPCYFWLWKRHDLGRIMFVLIKRQNHMGTVLSWTRKGKLEEICRADLITPNVKN